MRAILLACLLALSGCVTLNEQDCRTVDWYRLGDRDGVNGSPTLIDQYTLQCQAFGLKPNDARYMEGWRDGAARKRTMRF